VLLSVLRHFTYLALFMVLTGAGLGLPFPEELTQLAAGFLAKQGTFAFWPALATTYAGILCGDYLLFRLGRRHGMRLLRTRWLRRYLTPRRRVWLRRHFARHDFWTIFAARHASGFRAPVFATAGAMGVRTRTFLLADGLSALLSVPLVVSLGYLFASQFDQITREMRNAKVLIAIAIVLVVGAVLLLRRWRARRSGSGDDQAAAPSASCVDPTPAERASASQR
jgi:membrane protein DedA with SNARE-associated domain